MTNANKHLTINIPEREKFENLTTYAGKLSDIYIKKYSPETRKPKGQFFTPDGISAFMAEQFDINGKEIRLLDPAAGTGILTAAFCDAVLKVNRKIKIVADIYENDEVVLPFLEATLASCKSKLEDNGKEFEYNVYGDFITASQSKSRYDFVIANPPYYKLSKAISPKNMHRLIALHPNIYTLFMDIAVRLLKPSGEAVFITPRSFCSGTYYNDFREQLLGSTLIKNIHIFESRKEVFHNEDILQESIVIKLKKVVPTSNEKIGISVSDNGHLDNTEGFVANYSDIVYKKNQQAFIRIPTSEEELKIIRLIDKWPNTLSDLGLEISTGPVVAFRTQSHLYRGEDSPIGVPLIWMHNMKDFEVEWPVENKKGKPNVIAVNDKTAKLLLPSKNYVLIKRFTSKEQARRLCAVPFLRASMNFPKIGLENHVNYIHKINGELSLYEAVGIAAILNTTYVDKYFRALNGNTQVNATDMRHIPLPSIEDILLVGKLVNGSDDIRATAQFDTIVMDKLNLRRKVVSLTKAIS